LILLSLFATSEADLGEPDYQDEVRRVQRLLTFHPSSLIAGLALIVTAILYKKLCSAYPEGFPGYFTVLEDRSAKRGTPGHGD
jgi:hypothetical protein